MRLTDEQKRANKRERMLEKAREYTTGTYCRKFVAPLFQKMIRAEWGASWLPEHPAIVDGKCAMVRRRKGECVCTTCGKVGPWSSGLGGFHTGHFLASRRNSILFDERNVAPQCSGCNVYQNGAPQKFRQWMEYMHGNAVIEELERLKSQVISYSREDLVDMRISYQERLDAAVASMT